MKRDFDFGSEVMKVTTLLYPVDTETLDTDIRCLEFAHQLAAASVIPAYEPDLDTPRTAQDLDITFLMGCAECMNYDIPLFKEWSGSRMLCKSCRESAEIRAQEHRSEERYERYCVANFMR